MAKKRHIDMLMEAQAAPLSKYWEKDLPTYSNPAADIISWRGDGEVPTTIKSKDLDSVVDLILDDGNKNVKKPKTVGSSMKNVAERSSQEIMDRADLLAEEHFGVGYSSLEQFDAGFEDLNALLELADTAHGPAFKAKSQQLQDDIDKEEGIKDQLGKKTKTVKEDTSVLDESAYSFDFSDDDMDHDIDYNVKLSESAPIQHLEESEDEDLDGITSLIREMNELENEIEEAVKNDDYDDDSEDEDDEEDDDDDEEDKKKKKKKDDNDGDSTDEDDDDADNDGGLSEGFEIDFDEDIFED